MKVAVEPQSEGEVEALAGMSATLREESPEVIDMRRSWIEGPKGKKVSERGSEKLWARLMSHSICTSRCDTT